MSCKMELAKCNSENSKDKTLEKYHFLRISFYEGFHNCPSPQDNKTTFFLKVLPITLLELAFLIEMLLKIIITTIKRYKIKRKSRNFRKKEKEREDKER